MTHKLIAIVLFKSISIPKTADDVPPKTIHNSNDLRLMNTNGTKKIKKIKEKSKIQNARTEIKKNKMNSKCTHTCMQRQTSTNHQHQNSSIHFDRNDRSDSMQKVI